MLPATATDADIKDWIVRDFGSHGGVSKLARKLGVSISTASAIRSGRHRASLKKAAALYGYIASDEPGVWVKSHTSIDPRRVGYVTWSESTLLDDVRRGLEAQKSLAHIARRLGVRPDRIGYAVRSLGLRKKSIGDSAQR